MMATKNRISIAVQPIIPCVIIRVVINMVYCPAVIITRPSTTAMKVGHC